MLFSSELSTCLHNNNWRNILYSIWLTIASNSFQFNHSVFVAQIFLQKPVNNIIVDDLVHCIARSSSAMVLTSVEQIFVFHEGFWVPPPTPKYSQVLLQCSPIYHGITYNIAMTAAEQKSNAEFTKDTPYLTPHGRAMGCLLWVFRTAL